MSTTTQAPKPKRRRYQFSLRTLLLVITVATVAFGGWVHFMRQRAQANRKRVAVIEEAVAALQELGGEVTSDYEKLRPRTWLEKQFDDPGDADDPVRILKVTQATHFNTSVSDADLNCLEGLTDLQVLALFGTRVTDAGIEQLKGLTELEILYLEGTRVTDEGVKKLRQTLPNCLISYGDHTL